MSWAARAPSAGQMLTRFRKPREARQTPWAGFGRCSFGPGDSRRQTWLSLAVSRRRQWTVVDVRELE